MTLLMETVLSSADPVTRPFFKAPPGDPYFDV
jgi:hypothetical protein